MGFSAELQEFPIENPCKYVDIDMQGGPEDLTKISPYIAITATDQRKNLWGNDKGPKFVQNGKLYAINLQNKQIHQINIYNFTENTKFHPHGIYYEKQKKQLSVISHGYDGLNSRIEVFKIDDRDQDNILAYSIQSLEVSDEYNGIVNDLVKISDNEYLMTKYLHYPDPKNGRQYLENSLRLKSSYMFQLQIHYTNVLSCKFDPNIEQKAQKLDCIEIDNTYGRMVNGMTWNQKDQVLVADSHSSIARVYQLDLKSDRKKRLKYQETVKLTSHPDNIEYDEYNNHFIIGGFGKMFELQDYNTLPEYKNRPFWSYVDILERNNNIYSKQNILQRSDAIQGCSAAILYNKTLVLGSWDDFTLQICDL